MVVAASAPGHKRRVSSSGSARDIANGDHLPVSRPWGVVDRILEETMIDVQGSAIENTDDLPLAMDPLVPDWLGPCHA